MKNIGIILAAGIGSRFSKNQHKQFIQINKRSVLSYSLTTFQNNKNIDGIFIVTLSSYFSYVKEICDLNRIDKLIDILEGGEERYLSVYAALKKIDFDCNVLIHDSARPLLASFVIDNSVALLKKFQAVTVVKSLKDSLAYFIDKKIKTIVDRQQFICIETPQCFNKNLIMEAYNLFINNIDKNITDDCGILLRFFPDVKIGVVEGNYQNIKITYPLDLKIIEYLSK